MEWILAGIAVYFVWRVYKGTSGRADASSSSGSIYIQTSATTRSYDRNAYRFDGLAHPEFRISYADEDGVVTDRDIYVDNWRRRGNVTYYYCWCFLRDDQRTFRSDRILSIVNLDTNRQIKDIASYRTRG